MNAKTFLQSTKIRVRCRHAYNILEEIESAINESAKLSEEQQGSVVKHINSLSIGKSNLGVPASICLIATYINICK